MASIPLEQRIEAIGRRSFRITREATSIHCGMNFRNVSDGYQLPGEFTIFNGVGYSLCRPPLS